LNRIGAVIFIGYLKQSPNDRWSESIAVGSHSFVEMVKNNLGIKVTHQKVIETDQNYALREPIKLMRINSAAKLRR
jgi:hypothetical protein